MPSDSAPAGSTGFLLGKFLPPHRGHQYLIEFARNYVDRLTVLVCTIEQEPIPGRLRYQWMCEAFPGVDLVHHTDEIPQAPEEHPDFWPICIHNDAALPIQEVHVGTSIACRLAGSFKVSLTLA